MIRRWDKVIDIGQILRREGVAYIVPKRYGEYVLCDKSDRVIEVTGEVTGKLIKTLLMGEKVFPGVRYFVENVIDKAFKRRKDEFQSNCVGLLDELVIAAKVNPNIETRYDAQKRRMFKVLEAHL